MPDAIVYQIFPDRFHNDDPSNDPPDSVPWTAVPTRENFFGGDLKGIIDRLDYLEHLGVNTLYLNPIFRAGTNHRYDTFDYFQIDPALGNDAIFDQLVKQAHSRGIRILLDGVFNHCGLGFAPFQDVVRHGTASRYRNWFDIYDFPVRTEPIPNYATCGGTHYLPRLNTCNPEVEAFIHKVALYWLDRGIDGWRLDVPYEIHPDFWRRFRTTIKGCHPQAYLVAEEWRDPTHFLHGDTFDGTMHYQFRDLAFDYILKDALTGDAFLRALIDLFDRLPAGAPYGMLTLLGSHYTERVFTAARGDTRKIILLFTLLLTLPGAPLIYYGDENGMQGHNDPDCRHPMVWDPDEWQEDIRKAVITLTNLRRRLPALRRGRLMAVFSNDRVAAYELSDDTSRVLVIFNNSSVPRDLVIPTPMMPEGTILDVLHNDCFDVRDGCLCIGVARPHSAWVLTSSGRTSEPASKGGNGS